MSTSKLGEFALSFGTFSNTHSSAKYLYHVTLVNPYYALAVLIDQAEQK